MQMEMQVAVDMIELQAGGVKFFKLGMDFGAELFAQIAPEEILQAGANG